MVGRNNKEAEMGKKTDLERWLEEVLGDRSSADPAMDIYEVAVVKGLAAQATHDETDPIDWLTVWAAKLTPAQVEEIRARREAETTNLRQDIEMLLDGDLERWTEAERAQTEAVGRRLAAVSLVLEAREGRGNGRQATTFLPKEEDAQAAATAA